MCTTPFLQALECLSWELLTPLSHCKPIPRVQSNCPRPLHKAHVYNRQSVHISLQLPHVLPKDRIRRRPQNRKGRLSGKSAARRVPASHDSVQRRRCRWLLLLLLLLMPPLLLLPPPLLFPRTSSARSPILPGSLGWTFQPCQKQMKVVVGEAALAFYKARNLTDTAITGVST